jgi:hypothetical protein
MSIIPFQSLKNINGFPVDPQTLLIYWGPFQAGDEGAPISVYAYSAFAWHFTGYAGNSLSNANIPICADRSMTISASNDKACWGPVFTLNVTDPAGMNDRTNDPMRSGYPDGQYMFIKPIAGGTPNSAGPDCGILLFCARLFGPRTD